nr:MAG TPA: hypothetical protein [Caudoviricetes sp.]
MKPEEAIEILQRRIDLTKKVWSNVPEIIEYREALELAVKALQVQIPMKPDNTCDKHTENGVDSLMEKFIRKSMW